MYASGFTKYLSDLRLAINFSQKSNPKQVIFQRSANSVFPFLNNLQFLIYHDRIDLQKEFNLNHVDGLQKYIKWFDQYSNIEYSLNPKVFSQDKNEYDLIFLTEKNNVTGYGAHSINFYESLKKEIKVKKIEVNLNLNFDYSENNGILPIRVEKKKVIFSFTPSEIVRINQISDVYLNAFAERIIYFAWELEQIPDAFKEELEKFDKIVTVSQYCMNNLKDSGFKNVYFFPAQKSVTKNISPDKFKNVKKKYKIERQNYILHIADSNSCLERKNTLTLIKTFKNIRLKNKGTLLIKISNLNPEKKIDKDVINEIRNVKQIRLITDILHDNELNSLLKNSLIYVSPHRAEGFGIPIFKSLMFGVPTIATNYSGNLEYMNQNSDLLIPFNLVDVNDSAASIYNFPGAKWAQIDFKTLQEKIEKVLLNRNHYLKQAKLHKIKIHKEYNSKIVNSSVRTLLS
jgi:glycosyltransferase involved in cell wall biosynthesis